MTRSKRHVILKLTSKILGQQGVGKIMLVTDEEGKAVARPGHGLGLVPKHLSQLLGESGAIVGICKGARGTGGAAGQRHRSGGLGLLLLFMSTAGGAAVATPGAGASPSCRAGHGGVCWLVCCCCSCIPLVGIVEDPW